MRARIFSKAICISVLIHAAFFAVAMYAQYLRLSPTLDGGGEENAFTISVIADNTGSPRTVNEPARQSKSQMVAPSKVKTPKKMSNVEPGIRSGTGQASSPAEGGGEGSNIGPGLGKGDAVLSNVWKKINRAKYYPLHARRNSWEGNPRVTFKIGSEGQIEYVRLTKSCGITELDDAAVETVRRSAPLAQYPRPITLTIRYSLRE